MWRISGVIDGVLVNALVEMVPEMAIRLLNETTVETVVQLVNIGVKPDYTVRLEVDVDEFYKTVGEEKRHFVKPD